MRDLPPGPSRREVMAGALAAAALPLAGGGALASSARRHGMSAFGDLEYAPGFSHFSYVNPDAPKGGLLSLVPWGWALNQNPQTFNTMNTLVLRGDAPVGLDMVFDSLMVRALDEPDAVYGLVADEVEIAADGNTCRFFLRSRARWHDGTPLTAHDVAFTFDTLKAYGHPLISQNLREVESVSADGDHEVAVVFTGRQSRDLPLQVAGLPLISRAYYSEQDFQTSTLTPPLASGPYRVGRFSAGRFIEYDRVEDYWARDLPVMRGRHNFDTVRFEFFRDRDTAFEAFSGGTYLLREEFTARVWATGYDFPAVRDGRVVRIELPDDTPSGAQGWFMNLRRPKFADARVREALINAFDFEWTNRTLFHDLYERTHSYFQNSDLMAEGSPDEDELALLEPHRAQVPDEVFTEPYVPPVSDGSGQDRRLLRQAAVLLQEAGWRVVDGVLRNESGQTFDIEFIDSDGSFERVAQPYIRNLSRLGIRARFRILDASQYQSRINDFDFDMVVRRYSMSSTPGEGVRTFWTSEFAGIPGSSNLSGIREPVIDALTDIVINARSRDELTVAARALDRVLRAGRYWVPHWYKGVHHVACWDVFDRPAEKPRYGRGILDTWWHDAQKAARIGRAR